MAYIGNKLADAYTSFAKQDFTTSATTSYTLDNPVTNENEIALFINFVRQEPTTAYTASGTSLTLTSATSASDDMYCVYLGKALQTVNPPAGSVGLSQLSATGTASASTYLRGDNSWGSITVGDNTPAFYAVHSTGQSINTGTWTKVTYDSEVFDTDNCYDNATNYRFTPTTAGKYFVCGWHHINAAAIKHTAIYKNGSSIVAHRLDNAGAEEATIRAISIVDMNGSTDYLEIYARQEQGTTQNIEGNTSNHRTGFFAYKLNGV